MKLKDITELTCVFLQKHELLDLGIFADDHAAEAQEELKINKDLQLLNRCANLVYKEVACDYLPLVRKQTFETSNGAISYADFDKVLQDVKEIRDAYGKSVKFYVLPDGLETVSGTVCVKYAYVPSDCGFFEELDYKSGKIGERVFAYGTAAEYCMISGLYEDALIWEQRYKDALLSCVSKKSEIRIPARRWV